MFLNTYSSLHAKNKFIPSYCETYNGYIIMANYQYKTTSTPLSTISTNPDDLPPRNSPSSKRYCKPKFLGIPLYILWTLLIIAILALVLPLAIMFGRKNRKSPPSTVLVPLYIYPDPGAWDPLFTAYLPSRPLNIPKSCPNKKTEFQTTQKQTSQ